MVQVVRTEMTLARLKAELETNCGDMLAACVSVGISMHFVRQWMKDDTLVAEALKEAEQVGIMGLQSAAIQRAVKGIEEDVYFKGEVVGQKIVYSDGLLQTLLKAKIPEFSKDGDSGAHVTVNIANVMPRANSYEEWLAMKSATLEAPAPKLPPPDKIIDAEYTSVPSGLFEGVEL